VLRQSITKNSLILGGFAVLTAAILAFTFGATAEKISEQEKQAAQKALFEIIPQSQHDNNMLDDVYTLNEAQAKRLSLPTGTAIHLAYKDNAPVAAIIPSVTPQGYSGDIKLLVGVNIDGSIAGVRVLSHKETPGLGDKIDLNKSDWVLSFNGTSLNNPAQDAWTVKKEGGAFDQFTGATITPRAVVNQVEDTLVFFNQYKDSLFTTNLATNTGNAIP